MSADRTPGDFGSRLREARERRGITLRQIASSTKISVAVLDALERNDISRLPGGIFGRAFVRSYAAEVGLDPEATLQDFMATFPSESVTAGHPKSKRIDDEELLENERRRVGTYLALVAISIPIVGVMLWVGVTGRRAGETAAPETVVAGAPLPSRPEIPIYPPAVAPGRTPDAIGLPAPAPTASSGAVVPASASSAAAPAAATSAASPDPGLPRRSAASPSQAEAGSLTVGLSIKGACWVSATVDGQNTIDRLLQPGDRQTIEVKREMVLTAGDAAAISMTLNGAAARSLGKAGDVVTVRVTPNNFSEFLHR